LINRRDANRITHRGHEETRRHLITFGPAVKQLLDRVTGPHRVDQPPASRLYIDESSTPAFISLPRRSRRTSQVVAEQDEATAEDHPNRVST